MGLEQKLGLLFSAGLLGLLSCGGGSQDNSSEEKPVQGCLADYECKGERVCVGGKCVDKTNPNGNPDTVSFPDITLILPDTSKSSPDTTFVNPDTFQDLYHDSNGEDNQSFPDASCKPKSYFGCHQGEVWWFDSCQEPQQLKEYCSYGCEEGLDEGICKEYKDTSDSSNFDEIINTDIFIPEVVGCSSGEYTCNNGECISKSYLCDGDKDCSKGEDEEGCNLCEVDLPCGTAGEQKCSGSEVLACVYYGVGCLGYFTVENCGSKGMYCEDGTCKSEEPSCPPGDFQCLDYNCIPLEWVCNGAENCLGGEDEQGCAPSCIDECDNIYTKVCYDNKLFPCVTDYDGDACLEWGEPTDCNPGMYCLDGDKVCKPKPADPDAGP